MPEGPPPAAAEAPARPLPDEPAAEHRFLAPSAVADNGRRRDLPSLTGARWWAALVVFVLHALVFMPVYPFQKSELFRTIHSFVPMQLGSAGVTFFFVLSGFIIYWSNSEMSDRTYFVGRRLLKIYPSHLVAAVLFLVVAAVPLGHLVTWLPNLLLVHTYDPVWTRLGGANVPSWSLVAELLFYCTFPLFLPLVRRIRGRAIWVTAGALFGAIVVMHLVIWAVAPGYKGIDNTFVPLFWQGDLSPLWDVHASPAWFAQDRGDVKYDVGYWLSYNFPPVRLPEFYLGVLGAKLVLEGLWRNRNLAWPMLALVAAFALTWVVPVNFKMSVLMLLPTVAVVCTLAVRDLSGTSGFTASRRMVWLGNISFAFYLVQFPVMVAANRWLIGGHSFGFLGWLGFALLVLVVSVVLADLMFRFVDDPLMKSAARRHRATRARREASGAPYPVDVETTGSAPSDPFPRHPHQQEDQR